MSSEYDDLDLDLALVADDLAGALDPARSRGLHERLAADPAAAARYAEFARMLSGVSAVLAAEPAPPVPDDVLRRLDAAFQREVDTAVAHEKALARRKPGGHRSFWGSSARRRSFGSWTAGLVGVAAVAGVVAVVVHSGGGASTASSSSAGASKVSSGSSAGLPAAPERVPSAAAAEGGPSTISGPSAAAPAEPSSSPAPRLSAETRTAPTVVTTANLASVVRAVYPVRDFADSSPASGAGQPTPAVAGRDEDSAVPATCRPAGVAGSVPLLAAEQVRFAGAPAVLLVLAEPTDRSGTVRATVVSACGSPALLSQQVAAAG